MRTFIAGALSAVLVYETLLRWLGSVGAEAERARDRRSAYDAGVGVGRELQRAMHTGQAPFPPTRSDGTGFGDQFPRYGVEREHPGRERPDRMQWGAPSATHYRPPGDDPR